MEEFRHGIGQLQSITAVVVLVVLLCMGEFGSIRIVFPSAIQLIGFVTA